MNTPKHINKLLDKSLGIQIKKSYPKMNRKPLWGITRPRMDLSEIDLGSYLRELDSTFKKSVGYPGFIKTKGAPKPLFVGVNKGNIRAMCFSLPTTDYLHLHSVTLLNERGEPLGVGEHVEVRTSSRHEFDKLLPEEYPSLLFNTDTSHSHTFQTEYEHNPWMTITFPEAIYVGGVIIRNRKGKTAIRAAGLQISTTSDLMRWQTVYDFGGLENYSKKAEEIAIKYKLDQYDRSVYEFTRLVVQGKERVAREQYDILSKKHKLILRKAINLSILNDQDLEWNSHGIRRTFRFWKQDKKQRYILYSQQIIDDLSNISQDVCFGFGSVLAAVRDKDLIPHDDDMDIIIAFQSKIAATLSDALDLVQAHMAPLGYKIEGRIFNLVRIKNNEFSTDVFVGVYDSDEKIGWSPGPRGLLKRTDVFPAKKVTLLNTRCSVPIKPEKYLRIHYGKDWLTPDLDHKHNTTRIRKSYKDIAS